MDPGSRSVDLQAVARQNAGQNRKFDTEPAGVRGEEAKILREARTTKRKTRLQIRG
jgi:hypothetical protein